MLQGWCNQSSSNCVACLVTQLVRDGAVVAIEGRAIAADRCHLQVTETDRPLGRAPRSMSVSSDTLTKQEHAVVNQAQKGDHYRYTVMRQPGGHVSGFRFVFRIVGLGRKLLEVQSSKIVLFYDDI